MADLPKNQEELNKAAAEFEKQSKKKKEEVDIVFGAVVQQAKKEKVAATAQEQVQQVQAQEKAEEQEKKIKEKEEEKAKATAPVTTSAKEKEEEKLKQQQFLIEEQKRKEEKQKLQEEERRKAEEQRRRDAKKEKKKEKKEDLTLVISEPTPQADFRAEQKSRKELSLDDQKSLKELLNLDFAILQQMEPSAAIKLLYSARRKASLIYHPDKVNRLDGEGDAEFAKRKAQAQETMQKINDLMDKVVKVQESRLPNQAIDQQKIEAAKQRRPQEGYNNPVNDPRSRPVVVPSIYSRTAAGVVNARGDNYIVPYVLLNPPYSMVSPPAAPPAGPPLPGSWAASVIGPPMSTSSPHR